MVLSHVLEKQYLKESELEDAVAVTCALDFNQLINRPGSPPLPSPGTRCLLLCIALTAIKNDIFIWVGGECPSTC